MTESRASSQTHNESNSQRVNTDLVSAAVGSRGDEMRRLGLLVLLAGHKRTILYVTITTAILVSLLSIIFPDWYTATTTILPPAQNESAATPWMGQVETLSGLSAADLGLTNPTDLCIAILKSRSIQDAIVDEFDLRSVYSVKESDDARKELDERTEILADKEGQISLTVRDHDPKRSAQMANAYVAQLRLLSQNLAKSAAEQRRSFYQQELSAERGALSAAESSLRQAQEKTGLVQPDAQERAIIGTVTSTRARVGMAEVKLQAMRTYAMPDNPDLKRAEAELAGLREQLAKLERSTDVSGDGNLEIPTRRLPEVELEYIRRARDLKYHEALYEFLSRQVEAARIDEAKQGAIVEVVDEAQAPETRSGPHRTIIVVATTVVALLLCCLWTMVSESIQRDQVEQLETPSHSSH